jgi:tripartite-type tricarboxylate transporter receptor subunit TctC
MNGIKLFIIKYLYNILLAMAVTGAANTLAQDYPVKPVRLLTSTVGGSNDLAARLVAPALSTGLGQQVIVDNRAGVIAVEVAAKSPPDGYALLLYGNVTWLDPLMRDKPLWDPLRDFSPVTLTHRAPNILVVHPSLPVKTVKELIALAKARPGELNVSTGAYGGSPHLASELFKTMAGVNIVHILYKGTGPAVNDVIAGHVQVNYSTPGPVLAHIKSGRLRGLAVTSAQPSALAPGLPTVASAGLPGYDAAAMSGILAPAKTAAAIVSRLNQELVQIMNRSDMRERFINAGMEPVSNTPEQFSAAIKSEMTRMGKVIKDAGIRAE